ncbi:MAG TPA: cell division protein FtsZ, partial [Gemmatimonadaceae bacterium]
VNEPAMQGEIRVTVIATGFDRAVQTGMTAAESHAARGGLATPVIPFPAQRQRAGTVSPRTVPPAERRPSQPSEKASQDLSDMEIPTFIRRQMD